MVFIPASVTVLLVDEHGPDGRNFPNELVSLRPRLGAGSDTCFDGEVVMHCSVWASRFVGRKRETSGGF